MIYSSKEFRNSIMRRQSHPSHDHKKKTALTQSVECRPFKPKVEGSSPSCGGHKMLGGAGEARRAHNPEVDGSKPSRANA